MTTTQTQNGHGQKTTALARPSKQSALKELFEKSRTAIAQVVPKHFTPDRVIKLVLAATSRQPELAECTQGSLLQCAMTASALGLEPNTPLGHCYLVAYKNKKQGIVECTFQLGYKGYVELARRSGNVATIEAVPVFEHDFFDHAYGLNPRLEHRIALENRGALKAAWAMAQMQGGARQFRVIGRDDINVAKKSSKTSDNQYGPWMQHEAAMAAKTAIRRLGNQLPLSIEIRGTAMHLSTAVDSAEAGTLINAEEVADLAPVDSLEETLRRQAENEDAEPASAAVESWRAELETAAGDERGLADVYDRAKKAIGNVQEIDALYLRLVQSARGRS